MRKAFILLVCTIPCFSQNFKGHHIGESPSEFFAAEPEINAKLIGCRSDAPHPLSVDEIRSKFGNKTLKEYEKRRATNPTFEISSADVDVYGDRCGALVDVAAGMDSTIDGTGYDSGNKYEKSMQSRESALSGVTLDERMALMQAHTETLRWKGIDLAHKFFIFRAGKLYRFGLNVFADYVVIVDDVTKKMASTPHETLMPMHNAYGATWNDASTVWDSPSLHITVYEDRNPASHAVPRLTVETEGAFLERMAQDKNRPSSLD